ncbi:MAG: hypothetical protein LN561_02665 [Rickettsia endosymbiont of Labidopullus appendiculatus]|nr:hypothetical protein [Rickettsia endosymbiont of Labidopullus appendiculatus]
MPEKIVIDNRTFSIITQRHNSYSAESEFDDSSPTTSTTVFSSGVLLLSSVILLPSSTLSGV